MSPSELAVLFEANPDAAFRLTLSSGDVGDVTKPAKALIESSVIYIGQHDKADAREARVTRIVSIPNIALVEHVDPSNVRGRRPRP